MCREVFSNVVEVLSVSVTSYIVNIVLLFLLILIVNYYLPPLFNRYVKIREIKAVTGKCATCSILSQLRKKFKDRERREYLTYMFALHRTAYMGERSDYAKRLVIYYLIKS